MSNDSTRRIKSRFVVAAALFVILACGVAISFAHPQAQSGARSAANPAVPPGAHIDPSHVIYSWPSQIQWLGHPGGPHISMLVGDPAKPGLYIQLIKWSPHQMSRPHFHNTDRYITVLSGTWWVGTSAKFEPDTMVPMPAGSFVTDLAGKIHFDGAKEGTVIIEIVGQGPVSTTPAEKK